MSLIADTEPSGYAPRLAAGIVFYARMLGSLRVEHIGIPFEHRGRTFAIHRSTIQGPLDASRYEVSDVESGLSLEGSASRPSRPRIRPRSMLSPG